MSSPTAAAAPGRAAPSAVLRPYVRLTVAGFRQQSTYLGAAAAGVFTNAVFGFVKMAILLATLAGAGGVAGGYTPELMVSYIFLSQGMLTAIGAFGGDGALAERIRTGDIAVDFLRPVNVQFATLATVLGGAVYSLIPRALPLVAIGAATSMMAWAGEPAAYPLAALSVLLSIVLAQALLYCVQVLGFWVVDTRGIQMFYMVAGTFLMGMFVPVGLFPGWLARIAECTPFGWTLMPPCDILSGRIDAAAGLTAVGIQAGWTVAVLAAGALLTAAGRRRLEVQGG
ncbi:ABC-2 family transporter protein [Tsukamurella tyrosinosolvens]|uniref:ABC transporter permease n=1 Tax=Tsukamurella tyrosinosolvens TaxID=57704 RepID=UPI00079726BD|nr:ABC-2 family transporter protein [Tsukamurella tyrosinosolvens]KXP07677.1 ABC transporter permease [Tsukamurella tyrosinosolvens]KZL98880.1 ABC transporter permease [Tsukamurella tyrosinosolvens]MCA4995188.1 ABC-2 family transporter protein [Tsukamurella tyrosinosolvens]WEL93013.1 ABC-2 family transporter protein [Tsukamurella tyrosinosolvens]